MPKIDNTDLRPNQYVLVKGTLVWSRIASQVEGEELAEIQRERAKQNRPAPNRPYTTVTIIDPQIVKPKEERNQPLTIEEQYIKENRFYTSHQGRNKDHVCFSPTNNGRFLPALYRRGNAAEGEDPKQLYQVFTDKEIARGADVLILMRSFSGQMGHNGIAMNAVIVLDDHINYYGESSADADALRKWGLIVNHTTSTPSPEEVQAIKDKTVRIGDSAPLPIAGEAAIDDGIPAQDDDYAYDSVTFDPNVSQGIGIDSLFGEE